jgi:shikimate kinase
MQIFLIGMPGSGKSTIGRYLSESLALPVYDLDKLIEQEAAMSIPEIFETKGEEEFRLKEQQVLIEVIKNRQSGIISTGGGAPCYFNNLELMQAAGTTIYIDVPLNKLIERTTQTSKRPLLQGNHIERITNLLKDREEIYNKAEIVIKTKGKDSSDIAKEISALLKVD